MAFAASSVVSAVVGSIVPSTWPVFTRSPTATFTEVTVPLVPKSTEAEFAAETFPEALTLDCTVPRATVAVRCVPVLADELLLENPYTASSAKNTIRATITTPAP